MKMTAARHLRRSGRALAIQSLGAIGIFLCSGAVTLRAQQIPLPKLRPPHDEIGPTYWEQHHWPLIIGGIALLFVIALAIVWSRRTKPIAVTPPEVLARNSLARLRGQPQDPPLVVEVSRIVRNYLVSVFMLPPDELTTTELLRAMKSRSQIDESTTAAVSAFLRQCDEWKFAPARLPPQTGVVARASELVEMIEKQRHQPPQGTAAQPTVIVQSAS